MKKFPNAFVIILSAILLAWIFTFIIPTGSYERIIDSQSEIIKVVPGSYEVKDAPAMSAFDALLTIPRGIADRAELIVLILLLGGCFYVIEKTGALNQGLNQLIILLKGKESLALLTINILFILAGFTIGLQEEVIAMTPILLLFGRSLGYSAPIIILSSYGAAVLGSAFSPFNPFGVLIAQKEAQLELMSGTTFRIITFLVVSLIWLLYIWRISAKNRVDKVVASVQAESLSLRNKLILILLGLTFSIVTYGLIQWGWGFNEMSGCFFLLAIFSGLLAKFNLSRTTEIYVEGFKEMIFAAMIIGLANSISIILKEGSVIDTIIFGLFTPLQYLGPSLSAVIMMFSHAVLHVPISSYSGQAILTMPILTPLSDLIGLSRQVTVLAYQYGAILMDLIVPTNGSLMAVIALGGIPYNQWFKVALKPLLLMLGISVIALLIAVQYGLN